jgi:hypothetical protein
MKISDKLREIADQIDRELDGLGGRGTGHVLAETGPEYPTYDANGVCVEDYWVRGRIGCMKGARQSDYSICFTMTGLAFGGDVPKHLFTVASIPPGPQGASGLQLLASVADAGWMDGTQYRPRNPPGQNYAEWNACGRPSGNQYGTYDGRGEFVNTDGGFSPGPRPGA